MSPKGYSRRGFLRRALLVAAGAAAWAGGCGNEEAAVLARRLIALLGPPEALARIGHAYLAGEAAKSRSALLAGIRRDFGDLDPESPEAEVTRALRSRIAADFQEDRTLQIEGWVLSATEVHLSALSVLLEPPPDVAAAR